MALQTQCSLNRHFTLHDLKLFQVYDFFMTSVFQLVIRDVLVSRTFLFGMNVWIGCFFIPSNIMPIIFHAAHTPLRRGRLQNTQMRQITQIKKITQTTQTLNKLTKRANEGNPANEPNDKNHAIFVAFNLKQAVFPNIFEEYRNLQ